MANSFDLETAHLLARCWREGRLRADELTGPELAKVQTMCQRGQLLCGIVGFYYHLSTQGWIDIYDLTVRHIDLEAELERRAW